MSLSLALDKYAIRIVYLLVVYLQVQAKVTLKVTNQKCLIMIYISSEPSLFVKKKQAGKLLALSLEAM